ncbi:MAG: hypothetical protein OEY87_01595 [Gammaproteobacteria bacterium]|nr:hypothetical protein [Gammaproteobacteria bacterium]MDH5734791.1 hypothetical protein [Gammaproteobacteria bacterium]
MLNVSIKNKMTGLGATTLLLCSSFSAQATIVVPACSNFAVDCEFLEFSYSQNYSRDEIDILRFQEGSVFYGYQYASRYETATLLDSYSALPLTGFDTGWSSLTYSAAVNFLNDFGVLNATSTSGSTSFFYGTDSETIFNGDLFSYLGYVAYDDGNAYVPARGYFYETQGTDSSYTVAPEYTDDNSYDMYTASLLVRYIDVAPVPVPAAVWLFGSGLVGLIGIARRRRV